MKRQRRSKRHGNGQTKIRLWSSVLLVSALFLLMPLSIQAQVTEQDILDAILGKRTFTNEELLEMDLNGDGAVDAADMVYFSVSIASFDVDGSETNETAGTHNVTVTFTNPVTCILNYTIGGTASTTQPPDPPEDDDDYIALSGSVAVDGSSVMIQIPVLSDTVYEGDETIELNLLPGEDYLLGEVRSHTITLKDNPGETAADYIFILSSETPGVDGNTTDGQGFPPTLFTRTAGINITFSQNSVLNAEINVPKSIGIADTVTPDDKIPATSVSYSAGTLEMVFEYSTQSESFVVAPSITSFDPGNPAVHFGVEEKKTLTNTLTITVTDFDVATQKFTDHMLEGTFSLSISGVFSETTSSFFNGTLVATMQQ